MKKSIIILSNIALSFCEIIKNDTQVKMEIIEVLRCAVLYQVVYSETNA